MGSVCSSVDDIRHPRGSEIAGSDANKSSSVQVTSYNNTHPGNAAALPGGVSGPDSSNGGIKTTTSSSHDTETPSAKGVEEAGQHGVGDAPNESKSKSKVAEEVTSLSSKASDPEVKGDIKPPLVNDSDGLEKPDSGSAVEKGGGAGGGGGGGGCMAITGNISTSEVFSDKATDGCREDSSNKGNNDGMGDLVVSDTPKEKDPMDVDVETTITPATTTTTTTVLTEDVDVIAPAALDADYDSGLDGEDMDDVIIIGRPDCDDLDMVDGGPECVPATSLRRADGSSSLPVAAAAVKMSSIGELAITKPAPDFECNAVVDGSFKTVKLSSYRGKYVVLFFYPLDFTFVCPTEIIAFSDRAEEFRAINCEVLACSTDSVYSHLAWIDTPRKQGGLGHMKIPLLADRTQEISKKYGCLKPDEGIAFRGLYIIDDKGNLRQMSINDLPVGRSVDETLRLVQAFQFTDKHGEVCPVGWKPGKETMKPNPQGSLTYFNKVN